MNLCYKLKLPGQIEGIQENAKDSPIPSESRGNIDSASAWHQLSCATRHDAHFLHHSHLGRCTGAEAMRCVGVVICVSEEQQQKIR